MSFEKKRIRQLLARNTLLLFAAFALLFSVFGVLVYQLVSTNVYRLADEQLSQVGATVLGQEIGVMSEARSIENGVSDANETFDTQAIDENSKADSTAKGSAAERETVDTQGSESAAEAAASSALAAEVGEAYVVQNPQLIYLLRDASGKTLEVQGLYAVYPDYFENIVFDREKLDQIYGLDVQGQRYRGVNYLLGDDGGTVYLQALVNVESEAALLDHFTKVLILYLSVAVVAAAAVSYLLSRRTIKPIVASLEQQTEFVQNASHELRTPLAVVRASQDRLLADPASRIVDRFEDINAAVDETKRLSRLVDDLMTLTLADGPDAERSEAEVLDVGEVVSSAGDLYADIAEVEGRSFAVVAASTGQVRIDRDALRQVLGVLLDNALKYTNEGDRIELRSEDRGNRIAVVVSDTGCGIAPEDRKQVFERFYRSADARTMPGNGLGLPIARALVERARGSIEVGENRPRGTVLTVLLPRA